MIEDIFAPKIIQENLDELYKELEKARERRNSAPSNRLKAHVYMASVTIPARSKENPSPRPKPEIVIVNVTDGHNKPAFIKNMARRGKFPLAYDFPSDEDLEAFKAAYKDKDILSPKEVSKFKEGDPYFEIRAYLDARILELTSGHAHAKKELDSQAKIRELEERLAQAEAKNEAKQGKKASQSKKEEEYKQGETD